MSDYNPYRKYSSYWWRYWLNFPGDVYQFFIRLKDFAPLLWQDNDYDFNATLHIVRFKLRRLRKHLEDHSIIAHAEDHVAELARADVLLRNVIEEDPDDEWSMHYNQWHIGKDLNEDCGAKEECHKSCNASMDRMQRNWFKLWAYVANRARGWWDVILVIVGVWSCLGNQSI